jgi:hypothetical protein
MGEHGVVSGFLLFFVEALIMGLKSEYRVEDYAVLRMQLVFEGRGKLSSLCWMWSWSVEGLLASSRRDRPLRHPKTQLESTRAL